MSSTIGHQWLRGDLHCHTHHSDAQGSLDHLIAKARAINFDFLAVTDHNTVSHHAHLPTHTGDDLIMIAGQEVTTYYGHMNVWGATRWCDFRCRTRDEIAQVIELAHQNGGICSINHPKPHGPPWEYGVDLPVDTIEVWQSPWLWFNEVSLALWDRLLNSGRRIPGVGGSDYHCPAGEDTSLLRLGWPTTWVKASDRSVQAVLDAIKAGRVAISAMPDGPRLDLQARADDDVAGIGECLSRKSGTHAEVEVHVEGAVGWNVRLIADGQVAAEVPITSQDQVLRFTVAAQRYLRAEVVGDAPPEIIPANAPAELDPRDWRWALSNPIYVEPQRQREHREAYNP